jgi:hypothetical protein
MTNQTKGSLLVSPLILFLLGFCVAFATHDIKGFLLSMGVLIGAMGVLIGVLAMASMAALGIEYLEKGD